MRMHVQPAPGRKVRDPQTRQHIPESGAEVPASVYWLRRVAAGDVIVKQPAPAPKAIERKTKEQA